MKGRSFPQKNTNIDNHLPPSHTRQKSSSASACFLSTNDRNLNTFVESIFLFFPNIFVVDDNKLFSEWKYTRAGAAAVEEEEEVAKKMKREKRNEKTQSFVKETQT